MINIQSENNRDADSSVVNDEYELLKIPDDIDSNNQCVICLVNERNSIFYPCGHECVCADCGK